MKKKILFVTATRADFGKLKSLIKISKKNKRFKIFIAVTGMHMMPQFGSTHTEVDKFFTNLCVPDLQNEHVREQPTWEDTHIVPLVFSGI